MRYWSNKEEDSKSVHAIGNGKFIVYGQGPNIMQFQGPPYSVPTYGTLVVSETKSSIHSISERQETTCNYVHTIYKDDKKIGTIEDYIDPEFNIFVREFDLMEELSFTFNAFPFVQVHEYKDHIELVIKNGSPYFTNFSLADEIRMLILSEGNVDFDLDKRTLKIMGKGKLIFISDHPKELYKHVDFYLKNESIKERSISFFNDYLKKLDKIYALIPKDHKETERIKRVLESVSVHIKCQQSFDGGVLAGHYYPMAYVRDQAGTLRGLLKLGHIEEAKAILTFWNNKFKRFGNIVNADSMGHNQDRLLFSNDEVEVTGYIIFCAFEYLKYTNDEAFINDLYPMLKWAFEAQVKNLHKGMLGFSGDETYIAGGVFDRSFLYHGSSESTLLFIESGQKFLSFFKDYNDKGIVREARDSFKDNFLVDGILYANNPKREEGFTKPLFHRGYCDLDTALKRPAPLMWLKLDTDGYYKCPSCYGTKAPFDRDSTRRYVLGSLGLLPVYYHSTLLSDSELDLNLIPFANVFKKKGYIPSDINSNRALGYDLGLLLYNLTYRKDPLKEDALEAMLDLLDENFVWVEYYDDMKPFNCRCRPWESAINIEALIYYLENY